MSAGARVSFELATKLNNWNDKVGERNAFQGSKEQAHVAERKVTVQLYSLARTSACMLISA